MEQCTMSFRKKLFIALLPLLFISALSATGAEADNSPDQPLRNAPRALPAGPVPSHPLSSVAEGAVQFHPIMPDEFVPGELLVKFKENVDPADPNVAFLLQEFGGELKRTHKRIKVHTFRLKNALTREGTLRAVERLRENPLVEFVEPNGIVRAIPAEPDGLRQSRVNAAYVPDDPQLSGLYALNRISAPSAWNLTTGDAASYVAVVDTGVNWNHPDLSGKVDYPSDQSGNCISSGTPPMDDNGHGTHVAGIAAAAGNNAIGIAGVAFSERILAVKVLDATGTGDWSTVACGIEIASAVPEVAVINLSVGGSGGSTTLYNAVYDAWVTHGKTVVAANGNEGRRVPSRSSYPACYSQNGIAISVGATNFLNNRAYYSSANQCITVTAPGDNILSTYSIDSSTEDQYASLSGTSMATPQVSGTVALIQSYLPRTNNDVRTHLINTAKDRGDAGYDIYYGYGIINAYRAVLGY